jgi:aspartyl/asparaginyl beta-hydroxylase (cupin superfamily)
VVFDDSFEHEAWNRSDKPRVVLVLDVWHPELEPAEKKFFKFLQKAQLSSARRLQRACEHDDVPNFLSAIELGRQLATDETLVW